MIRLLLIAAFLIGSPRDIANRPTKHVAPKRIYLKKLVAKLRTTQTNAVPSKVLVVPVVPHIRWDDWQSDNSNRLYVEFEVQKSPSLTGPWVIMTNGLLEPYQPVVFRTWESNNQEFYRVGFRWP